MNELVKAVLAGIDADSGDETAREEATEALLLLVARVAETEQFAGPSSHRCFTEEGDWVACPAELCEADFLLREAVSRADEVGRVAALLRKECGSAARFRTVYGDGDGDE